MIAGETMQKAAVAIALVVATTGCRDTVEGVRTEFVGSYAFTPSERRAIARIAGDAAREARPHLPALPQQITLRVRSGTDVIPEVGATAEVAPPAFIMWTVDPARPEGVVTIAETHLRSTLFHELHHLVRSATIPPGTLMDHVVTEGLATAFERDFAGASPPWGQYPDDVASWVGELLRLPEPSMHERGEWLTGQRNGRRWVGMRAGTYLADLAMKRLGKSAAELVSASTKEILTAAGFGGGAP